MDARPGRPPGRSVSDIRTADPVLRRLFQIAQRDSVSMAEIARRLGRSRVCVSRWKSGASSPQMLDVVGMAEALGCSITVEEKTDGEC